MAILSRFWDFDRAEIVDLLRELEFHSFVARIPAQDGDGEQLAMEVEPSIERLPTEYTVVDTEEALSEMVRSLTEGRQFSFDTETTSTNAMSAELVGFSFSNKPGRGWYVPVGHNVGKQLPMDTVIASLKPLLESDDIAKAAHNANYDMTVLANYDIDVRNLSFDTVLGPPRRGQPKLFEQNVA